MKNMVFLIDTNVFINFITDRDDPYTAASNELIGICMEGNYNAYMAFHSLSTIWYLVCKLKSEEEARFWLEKLCDTITVVGATQKQL